MWMWPSFYLDPPLHHFCISGITLKRVTLDLRLHLTNIDSKAWETIDLIIHHVSDSNQTIKTCKKFKSSN